MATRPRDRKAQIARASAEAFSTLGYHRVTMEDIASRVGVSATALYRHYSGKYELFRGAVLSLGQQLVDATEAAESAATGEPRADLDLLVAALTNTALANRESGGLYRWEGRFLSEEDQRELDRQVRSVHRRLQKPIAQLHPAASSRELWTTSTAVLSVLGSVVDHRSRLAAVRIRALLADCVTAITTAQIDVPDDAPPRASSRTSPSQSKYEALLDESMRLFNANGYRDTSVEEIAAAVGLPASGVYRYFARKSDLLAASFRRAADWMSAEIAAISATSSDPEDALTRVIDSYVGRSFDVPELSFVYYTEKLNLPAADQNVLRSMQRSTIESWVEIVDSVRSDWTLGEARFAVHAAMALVVDIGRLTEYHDSAQVRELLCSLLDLTLLGRYRLRIVLPAK